MQKLVEFVDDLAAEFRGDDMSDGAARLAAYIAAPLVLLTFALLKFRNRP